MTMALRGLSLRSRPLYSACSRRAILSVCRQRLPFSCCSRNSAASPREWLARDEFKPPDTPCRTRFAPSPTGYLHLGSLRTALYNYLLARATGGQFVLRIEDTDQSRLVPDAEQKLYEDLRWAGISWDEGPDTQGPYGPYRQSERLSLYKEHADKLVREGKAYRCFCSPEALEEHKRVMLTSGEATLYSGACRDISPEESDDRAVKGEPFAVRFKSSQAPAVFQDMVYGTYRKRDPEDDFIILKRDGFPTYHLANVVDDRHMNITHVIRGAEWLISTPKHVALYNALGWEPPRFGHLGLLVDQDRRKLSKRDDTTNLSWYKESHFLPTAVLNFVATLGWRDAASRKTGMSLQDMVEQFSLQFSKGDIVVSLDKLWYLHKKHYQRLIRDKKPEDKSVIERYVVDPIRAAIEEVEAVRTGGEPLALAPGFIPVASLGERLQAVRLEQAHEDLIESLLDTKVNLRDPGARFSHAVLKLRYFIWAIPRAELERSFGEAFDDESTPLRDKAVLVRNVLLHLVQQLAAVDEDSWTRPVISSKLHGVLPELELPEDSATLKKPDAVYHAARWALVANVKGPSVVAAMHILGREETLRRLNTASLVAGELAAAQADEATATQASVTQASAPEAPTTQ
ncbi:hypothetical protein VTK56DRAFT_1582 [Thermocarpiscus australiensis]